MMHEDGIIVPSSKITTSFYRKTSGSLESCHPKTLQPQLLITGLLLLVLCATSWLPTLHP